MYRSGTVNSNTVNSKLHLIRIFFEVSVIKIFYHFMFKMHLADEWPRIYHDWPVFVVSDLSPHFHAVFREILPNMLAPKFWIRYEFALILWIVINYHQQHVFPGKLGPNNRLAPLPTPPPPPPPPHIRLLPLWWILNLALNLLLYFEF